eukprot:CAMPEP_0197242614 /NCGR_PEP_ID=MMETSP1429-20130617/8316_1 /TAXON_ID=49237 /ORGANISM="Chaetoceros  sp., Strain UNC1202" /LENGTH=195 /DNA_ID=CAMNT_0042702677 /DNA_START=20 /DNA_END=607 /DNA_ORIENTATION=+
MAYATTLIPLIVNKVMQTDVTERLLVILMPLQGMFNFLIFVGHKAYNIRWVDEENTTCLTILHKIFCTPHSDPVLLSRISLVDHDMKAKDVRRFGIVDAVNSDKSESQHPQSLSLTSLPDSSELSHGINGNRSRGNRSGAGDLSGFSFSSGSQTNSSGAAPPCGFSTLGVVKEGEGEDEENDGISYGGTTSVGDK